MKKSLYTILKTETKHDPYFEVVKPDGTIVNEAKFKTLEDANKKLDLLVAMGYCRRET